MSKTSTPITNGLVSHFNAESLLDTVGQLTLNQLGNARFADSAAGRAFDMRTKGSKFILPDVAPLKLESFSIGAWVKWSGSSTEPAQMVVFRGGYDGGNDPFTIEVKNNGSVFTQINHGASPTSTIGTSVGALSADKWSLLMATYDRSSGDHKLFLDGNVVASGKVTGPMVRDLPSWADPGWGIGNHSGSQTYFNYTFNGLIDEVSFFSRALDEAEVQTIFRSSSLSPFSGTIYSAVTYALQAGERNLVLTGAAAIDGTGNALDNILTGNNAANVLNGQGGNDTLNGSGGSDTLIGGDGHDLLIADGISAANKYEFVDGKFTWEQAKADAQARGGHLATITSEEELSEIKQQVGAAIEGKNLWLGASDAEQEGVWKWITGETWGYTRWMQGQPDNVGNEDYLHLWGYPTPNVPGTAEFRWNDLPGHWSDAGGGKMNYLLEREVGPVGNNSLSGGAGNDTLQANGGNDTLDGGADNDLLIADQDGSTKYELVQGSLTWEQAKTDAERRGGHLATITSQQEWEKIQASLGKNFAVGKESWIGASDAAQEGVWKWVTGEPFAFSKWRVGEPTGVQFSDEDYLSIFGNDRVGAVAGESWNDDGRSSVLSYYLLEKQVNLSGNNSLSGGAGNDTLRGGGGNDTLNGGSGADSMSGGKGNDTYRVDNAADVVAEQSLGGTDSVFASVSHALGAHFENLAASSAAGLNLRGNGLQNFITGGAGADTLDGGGTSDVIRIAIAPAPIIPDTLSGGLGNDLYIRSNAFDPEVIIEALGGGTDTVRSSVTHVLAANVENLELAGAGLINGTGNALANRITGNVAANRLVAGAGSDTVFGGGGNDTLNAGLGNDTVRGEAGNDLLQIDWASLAGATIARSIRKDGTGTAASFSGSYTAKNASGAVLSQVSFDTIERLTLNGQVVDLEKAVAVPGVTIKRISAAAATTEQGGTVEYNVVLDKAPFENVTLNVASSDATEGKVNTPSLTFTALNWDKPQKLVVQGVDDYFDDGNVAYTINGQVVTADLTYNRVKVPVLNLLNNDDGEDNDRIIYGSDDTDYLTGANGHDRIYGKGGQDQLSGGIGNDRVYGENDNDRLFGELGNDELYGGYDDDTLDGGTGTDSLFGEQGRDTLLGGAGNDYLDGGLLNDSMSGGAGNDTYLVDSIGDVINDLGTTTDVDTVHVIQTISYFLPANVENAAITVGGNGNLTGNALNNGLTGNDGRNVIDGGVGNDRLDGAGGADSLLGGAGNDAFVGGMGNDTMRGGDGSDVADFAEAGIDLRVDLNTGRATGEGTDLLFDVENILAGDGQDTLLGNAIGNDLDGGAGIDSLNGGAGNDTLAGCFFGANGGRGETDTLTGGAGIDIFQLGWASGRFYDDGILSDAGRNDYVLIDDFTAGQDRLQLDGAAGNYYLGVSGVNGVNGIGLYAEQGATDELVAIIRSANNTQLNAANTINTSVFV